MSKLEFMLANVFDGNIDDYLGWVMSEKLDGYRARYNPDKKKFISRSNKAFNAPIWFTKFYTNVHLDGELFTKRGSFEEMGIVRKITPITNEWKSIRFHVYDAPEYKGNFRERYEFLHKEFVKLNNNWEEYRLSLDESFHTLECPIVLVEQKSIQTKDNLMKFYKEILNLKGEGVMLKNPKSNYEGNRSMNLLKLKPTFDEEAIIIGYNPGTGKYLNKLGSFKCKRLINMNTYHKINNNKDQIFSVSGMDDIIRENYKETHPINTIITYKFSGETNNGKPRFASYIRKRDDIILENHTLDHKQICNIIYIFSKLSNYELLNGEKFKSLSYQKAIQSLKNINSSIELDDLQKLDGIGKSIIEKMNTILSTGTCPLYDEIKDIYDPRNIFLNIHGVGTTKAKELMDNGYNSINDLIHCNDIQKHLNKTQLIGLKYYKDLQQKIPSIEISKHEAFLKRILYKIDKASELTITGSYRREAHESGDIDVLLKSNDNSIYKKFITILTEYGYLIDNLALGNKKYNGICRLGKKGIPRRIDIMYTTPTEYPFSLLYFTGPDSFNKRLRKELNSRNMKINEYRLLNLDGTKIDNTFHREEDIFDYLGMDYNIPKNRF